MIVQMPGLRQIGADPSGRLRIDGECLAASALAGNPQGVKATVLTQVADGERGDLGAPQPDLQCHGEDRPIPQSGNRVGRGYVEHQSRLRLGKAAMLPSSQLITGRVTSPTGLQEAAPCRTRCLNSEDNAVSRRRTVDAAARSVSCLVRSQAITSR